MNITIILYQALGIVFAIFGLSILINKKSIIALLDGTVQSYGILWILGFITLVPGTILIVVNRLLVPDSSVFIIIISWVIFLKGVITLLFPRITVSFYKKWVRRKVIIFCGIITFALGLILIYFGFF